MHPCIRLVSVALSVVIFAGCAATAARPDAISRVRLEAHQRFLASDALGGRMTGTPGYAAAAEYVASQLRLAGIEPAGTEGYLQPVPYAVALLDPKVSKVRLHRQGRARPLEWKKEWISGADVLRERTGVRAPMVFVGHGVSAPQLGHDDYAGLDVRGKVVVMLMGAPKKLPVNPRAYHSRGFAKERAAMQHGAVGTLLLRDAHFSKYPWQNVANNAGRVPSMRWVSADGKAADYFPELRGAAVLSEAAGPVLFEGAPKTYAEVMAADAAGEALPRFALAGEIEIEQRGSVSRKSSPNVVGLLRGSDPQLAGEYVVYSAHLDHLGTGAPVNGDEIYNGAYDNALGIAMLLETARALAAAPLRRSVLFVAVGGEERGLQGSDYFGHYPTVPAAQMVANINLDMPLVLFPLADVVAFGSEHSTLGAAVAAAAEAEGMKLSPDPVPEEVLFIRSDQYSFVRHGVPALALVAGSTSTDPAIDGAEVIRQFRKTHYHQPSDDLSRPVHWPSAERFARVNVRIGALVGNADERPRWHPGNFWGEQFGKGTAAAP
jgi:Zn-dependent M28 family amino/carboxypeptidase